MKTPIRLRTMFSRFRRRGVVPIVKPFRPIDATDKEYSEDDEVSYETRAIAFIGILGWGKAVGNSVTSPELRRKLLNAVWALGTWSKKDVEDDTPDYPSFDQTTQFSDSVEISVPYSGHFDLMRLVRQITSYQHNMLLAGFLLRGGIAVGPLYHAGPLVFGPALNEAYHLESKVASHPRIIIARSLDPQIEMAKSSLSRHWPFVVKDDDGFYSTDYLMMYAVSKSASKLIDQKIEHWLLVHKDDDRTFRKYVWLKARWEATKIDAGWRAEKSRQLRASELCAEVGDGLMR
jgi:hypothetical protein